MTQTSTRLAAELPPCNYQPVVYDGPSREQVLIDRQSYCNPAIFTLYSTPLMIVEGHLQYLFDETGRRYLDMLAGISTVSCGGTATLTLQSASETSYNDSNMLPPFICTPTSPTWLPGWLPGCPAISRSLTSLTAGARPMILLSTWPASTRALSTSLP